MAMSAGVQRGPKAEINITPLVDVVLVLLIIFMVVTPILQRGKDVRLALSSAHKGPAPADALVVSLTSDHKLFLEKDACGLEELGRTMRGRLGAPIAPSILLRADDSLLFGDVRRVMGVLRASGAHGVRLGVTEEKGR